MNKAVLAIFVLLTASYPGALGEERWGAQGGMRLQSLGKRLAELATVIADDNNVGKTIVLQCAENTFQNTYSFMVSYKKQKQKRN